MYKVHLTNAFYCICQVVLMFVILCDNWSTRGRIRSKYLWKGGYRRTFAHFHQNVAQNLQNFPTEGGFNTLIPRICTVANFSFFFNQVKRLHNLISQIKTRSNFDFQLIPPIKQWFTLQTIIRVLLTPL